MTDIKNIEFRLANIEKNQRMILDRLEELSPSPELPALISQRKVMAYLKINRHTLQRIIGDGLLHPIRKEGGRNTAVLYKSSEVKKLCL